MEHYDDGLEHSIWLSLMADRLRMLRDLPRSDGTLFVHIDDTELGYLLVLLDEIFGRSNRLFVVTFKPGAATGHKAINPGCVNTSNFVLMYAKDKSNWVPNRVYTALERDRRYTQVIINKNDNFCEWRTTSLLKAFAETRGVPEKVARKVVKEDESLLEEFVLEKAESVIRLARPDYEAVSAAARELIDKSKSEPTGIHRLEREGHPDMYFKGGERILFYSDKLKMIDGHQVAGEPLTIIWDDVLSNNLHKEGGVEFPKGKKPEALIKRVLDLSTQPGDWVLDSFAGSGTTGAVAHKMGRRWIMVELRDHCYSHIIPRLKRVVTGEDQDGASKAVAWKGGGGFKFYRLAESLLVKDKDLSSARKPIYVINPRYDAKMLIRAICKIENFRHLRDNHWHGSSSERHCLYVTTSFLSQRHLDSVSAQLGDEEALLIYCTRRASGLRVPDNIEVKKIPRDLLAK